MTYPTEEQQAAVRESWGLVRTSLRTHSLNFYIFFFEKYPEYQKLFKDFAEIPTNELPQQPKFRGHATRVFYAITSLVDNLDDLDIITDILQKTTRDHVPRGLDITHYENLLSTVLGFLEVTLVDTFTDRVRDGWEATAKVILAVVKDEMDRVNREAVQESWALVKNMRTNSVNFFIFFFERYPDYQELFKDFADIPVSELANHQKFRGHATRVFFAISSLVDNLDDLDIVVDILQKTTRDHIPRGIAASHYESLFKTVVDFLSDALGESFTPTVREAWMTTAKVMLSVINEVIDNN